MEKRTIRDYVQLYERLHFLQMLDLFQFKAFPSNPSRVRSKIGKIATSKKWQHSFSLDLPCCASWQRMDAQESMPRVLAFVPTRPHIDATHFSLAAVTFLTQLEMEPFWWIKCTWRSCLRSWVLVSRTPWFSSTGARQQEQYANLHGS